jgi:UDP-N-acetylglucosamine:LPS N-acetylglucosamine transferase
MIKDAQLPTELLPAIQKLSRNRDQLQRMRAAMQSLAHPQAAQHLADLVRELAAGSAREQEMLTAGLPRGQKNAREN